MAQNKLIRNLVGGSESVRQVFGTDGAFFGVALVIAFAFLFGGSARDDVIALAILRPVAIGVCAFGLWRRPELTRQQAQLIWLLLGAVLLAVMHLIPLPPVVWTQLPGHELIAQIDRATGVIGTWRPLSVAPVGTMNALFALAVPLAVMLIGFDLSTKAQHGLIAVVILCGCATVMLGIFQTISPQSQFLFPYKLTTIGAPNGLFANRNHQALFLAMMIPTLAVYASCRDGDRRVPVHRSVIALVVSLFCIVLIALAGSRAGLVALVPAVGSVAWLYRSGLRRPAPRLRAGVITIVATATGAALLAMIAFSGRSITLQRVVASRFSDESRLGFIGPVWRATLDYWPLGSGVGTFDRAYRVVEPAALLNAEYLNHAHNDFLELAMTGGLPAIILGVAAAGTIGSLAIGHFRDRTGSDASRFGRLGATLCVVAALGSGVDYPLRVPAIMAVIAVALLWLSADASVGGIKRAARATGGEGVSID